jgi:hypothetical protein
MRIRRLASAILAGAFRHASQETQEWGNAMVREMDFIESDWAALFWAIGSATAILRHKEVPMGNPSDILGKAQDLERKLARRTLKGGIVCLLAIVYLAGIAFLIPNLTLRIGACISVASMLYLTYQLYQWRGRGISPVGVSAPILTNFYRTELERQRDFHRGRCFWSRLVSMIPGYLLFCMGFVLVYPKTEWVMALVVVCFLALLVLAVPVNLKLAHKYQRQIDELDGK